MIPCIEASQEFFNTLLVRIAWLMTAQTPAPQGRVTMGREAAPQVTGPEAGPSTGRHTTRQRVFSDIAVMPAE